MLAIAIRVLRHLLTDIRRKDILRRAKGIFRLSAARVHRIPVPKFICSHLVLLEELNSLEKVNGALKYPETA